MSKHTPGPWTAYYGDWGEFRVSGGPDDDLLADLSFYEDKDEGWANAQLIAAAPDLAEALVAALDILTDGGKDPLRDGHDPLCNKFYCETNPACDCVYPQITAALKKAGVGVRDR